MIKLLKKKSVIAAIFTTGVVIIIFLLFGSNNFLVSAIKTAFSPVLSVTSKISYSVGSFKDYILEMQVYREENEKLHEEINSIKRQTKDVAELKAENERLTELLDLKSSLSFETAAGRVISYEPNNWYDTLVINKGTNDGVKIGAAVLSSNGIVGKVTDCGIGWARVSSLLNDETAIGVRVMRTGELAIVEGDAALAKQKYCKMSFFDKGIDMMPGDILETTGTAGVYPEGKIVGTVVSIQADKDGGEYAIVEPAADFEGLYEVLVVTGTVAR